MINFLKYKWLYALISATVIGIGLISIWQNGLKFGIDFTGGSVTVYSFEKETDKDSVKKVFEESGAEVSNIVKSEDGYIIRTNTIDEKEEAKIRAILSGEIPGEDEVATEEAALEDPEATASAEIEELEKNTVTLLRFESVGPSLGKETITKTATAALVAILGILLYISFTFKKVSYGLAAVGAMIHDFFILIGIYSIFGYMGAEIDALFITAVLTTMAFSVHDTIVVFDKIREYQSTSGLPLETLANKALTETMVRSINNSLTIVLMLVPLVVMGGDTIRYFALALLIGTIAGTYSSPFVATPLLVFLQKLKIRR